MKSQSDKSESPAERELQEWRERLNGKPSPNPQPQGMQGGGEHQYRSSQRSDNSEHNDLMSREDRDNSYALDRGTTLSDRAQGGSSDSDAARKG